MAAYVRTAIPGCVAISCVFLCNVLVLAQLHENQTMAAESTCDSTYVQCPNNTVCIKYYWACNGEDDCEDGGDEEEIFCRNTQCPDDAFRCTNHACIPSSWKCDGEIDCLNGEDEDTNTTCPESTCDSIYLQCPNSNVCIQYYWACDGEDDCGDGGDEEETFCRETQCPDTAFHCNNNACIPSYWKCNGESDCLDGEDEDTNTTCHPDLFTCASDQFTCDNNNCIPFKWICDSENDCGDHSDEAAELNCDPNKLSCDNGYNGGCSHICHPGVNGTAECSCRDGFILVNENRMCVPAANEPCESDTFTCANGDCISWNFRCDLYDDCEDGTDETERFCYNLKCQDPYWTCANGKCILRDFVCDHDDDCEDNSDEENCEYPICPPGDFTCPNLRCVNQDEMCDGVSECQDENDTDEQNCPDIPCTGFANLKCPNSNVCIHFTWACDGVNDCGDGGDEEELYCREGDHCSATSFRCNNHACIPSFFKCDGMVDCLDGEDEAIGTVCDLVPCTSDEFRCDNEKCIPFIWICDTENDCGDYSDEAAELNCANHTCPMDFYTCRQSRPEDNRCIPHSFLCDGVSDCEDGEDEDPNIHGCVHRVCSASHFTCATQLCIPSAFECDHNNDCGDSSDEGSHCVYRVCDDDEFSCLNGRCIPEDWRCDNDNDCRDNTDEVQCVTEPPTCPATQYRCKNGECIDHNLVCNKVHDCSDGSDELHCNINECEQLISNQCEYNCVDTTNSYYCTCQQGYVLNDDSKTCRDIDECNEQVEVCSQTCENIRGAFVCRCEDGYYKEPDGVTCKHNSDITPYLLIANGYFVRSLAINGTDYSLIAEGFIHAESLDFDYSEEKIYLTDVARQQIIRIGIDGDNSVKEVLLDADDDIPGLAGLGIDWIGRKMYWTDWEKQVIEVAELDGSHRKTLYHFGIFMPGAVAIDPRDSVLFWTDWGLSPYIGAIDLDGKNPRKLESITKLVWPNGLTIYYPIRKLFWIDAHLNYIGHANYDGSNFRELTGTGDLAHPFSISVFENSVYWTDWSDMAVYSADKWTLENKELLVQTLHIPLDVHIYHPLRQSLTIPNPCKENNGGCSHLCLLSRDGRRSCDCPNNFVLNGDGQTCTAKCNVHEFLCQDRRRCIPIQYKCDNEPDCEDQSDESTDCPMRHCDRGLLQCDNLNCTFPQYICDGDNDCGDMTDEKNCELVHCQPWEFKCYNGQCISHTEVCDLVYDCTDDSDENEDMCMQRTCPAGYFQCDNSYCIPHSWYCDLDNDCGDNSDEPHRICQSQQSTCQPGWEPCTTNYRCIPSYAFCDGEDNCRDNSDESNCHQRTCTVGEFKCDNHICIPGHWECDYKDDCGDGSDEQCMQRTCHVGFFQCDDGYCIPDSWYCDLDNDCGDNSDEPHGICLYHVCSESEWRCPQIQKCIPQTWVCDHIEDCGDGSDEQACLNRQCTNDYFQCQSGHCVRPDYVCDGNADCFDISDELNCPTRIPGGLYCPAHEFTCNNHLCVPREWNCDGSDDCGDGSDESLNICYTLDCDPDTHYHCDNKRCIPEWRACDGVDNCGDASDENKHEICHVPPECSFDKFKCANYGCVEEDLVCNDYDDCGDQSDERGCHKGTGSCATATCEQMCNNTEGGYYCSCRPGLQVTPDDSGCQDIDECLQNPCTQLCRNIKESYTCDCAEGYIDTGSSGMSCKAVGGPKRLLFSDGPRIRVFDNANELYTDVIIHEGRIDALDYDNVTLYWVDSALRAIKRANMPPEGAQSISNNLRIDDMNRPQDIAVDWVAQNIYWTDLGSLDYSTRTKRDENTQGPRISVAKTDGRYVKQLVINDLDKPGAIVVNPRKGVMYWADYGRTPKIEMASMDGSNRKVIVSDRLQTPTGLSIDFANLDSVYFCDMKANLIETMNWDGSNRKILIGTRLENPFKLDVFETDIYWTTGATDTKGKIKKNDKLGRGIVTTVVDNINLPRGIRLYQQQRYNIYPPMDNPCEKSQCSHLCLLQPLNQGNSLTPGYSCTCPNQDKFKPSSLITCKGAKEEPRPLPSDKPCMNGGKIDADGNCVCPKGFDGPRCESVSSSRTGGGGTVDGGALAGIFVIIILILVAVFALVFYYLRSKAKNSAIINDEAPVSYRGSTNVDLSGPSLPKTDKGLASNVNDYEMPIPHLQAVGSEPEKTG